MLKITHFGEITRFDLARRIAGRGRYWTTAYLVDGLLIDTGCACTAAELTQTVAGTALTHIINTHSHEDHIGANGPLQCRHKGLEIAAHPLALAVLADPRGRQPLHPYRRVFWGWPEACQGRPVSDGEWIKTRRHRFQVLYTPGHSPDHICLHEPDQKWLFTGDLFVGGKDRALRADCDIWQIIASLKRIAVLPIRTLFPGSARVREQPGGALQEKIAHYESLGASVLELHQRGKSINAIRRAVCGGPMWIELFTLGHFSRRNIIISYLERVEARMQPPVFS